MKKKISERAREREILLISLHDLGNHGDPLLSEVWLGDSDSQLERRQQDTNHNSPQTRSNNSLLEWT